MSAARLVNVIACRTYAVVFAALAIIYLVAGGIGCIGARSAPRARCSAMRGRIRSSGPDSGGHWRRACATAGRCAERTFSGGRGLTPRARLGGADDSRAVLTQEAAP